MTHKVLRYGAATLAWLVSAALTSWLMLTALSGFQVALAGYASGALLRRAQALFLDKALTVALGLVWLSLVLAAEGHFREGVGRQDLLRRASKWIGWQLLLLLAIELVLAAQQGIGGPLHGRLMIGECVLGVALLFVSRWAALSAQAPAAETTHEEPSMLS